MLKICISGCGDIGQRVAKRYFDQSLITKSGISVYGLIRRREVQAKLQTMGITPVIADLDCPDKLDALPTEDAVLFHFVPPPNSGQTDPRFRTLLAACEKSGSPSKVILLSTTAVYGDCQGEWIDETAPVNPQTDRGKRRLDAETVLREWASNQQIPFVILRVSGIYGPGRLPIERLQQGLPILREDLAPYSNRIHQDDLAMVCVAAAERAPNGAVYNVCDGHPSTMSHYFKSIARALNLPAPPEIDREQAQQQLSAGMLSYLSESRRMGNEKMLAELGITLQYPDLAAGLASLKN
ncbi:SDR family oxidoreductase [Kaarinaea lacus]